MFGRQDQSEGAMGNQIMLRRNIALSLGKRENYGRVVQWSDRSLTFSYTQQLVNPLFFTHLHTLTRSG